LNGTTLGVQEFAQVRESGLCYIDKTAAIHQLITSAGRAVFLSGPRRFGKSLPCLTVKAIFAGRRDLFQQIAGAPALAIDSLDWAWEEHPMIGLDLGPGGRADTALADTHVNLNRDLEY